MLPQTIMPTCASLDHVMFRTCSLPIVRNIQHACFIESLSWNLCNISPTKHVNPLNRDHACIYISVLSTIPLEETYGSHEIWVLNCVLGESK